MEIFVWELSSTDFCMDSNVLKNSNMKNLKLLSL